MLLTIGLIALWPLRITKLWKSHDILLHSYRQAGFSQSLNEGNLVPRWGGNLNRGYGTPVPMFHYPLNHYLGHLFLSLGFNMTDVMRLLFAGFYLSGGIGMFFFLKRHTGTLPALAGALVFLLLPYRSVLIYVRGALGEHTALSFTPWVFLAFDKLSDKATLKKVAWAALGFSALILLHQAMVLMSSGLLVIFLLAKFRLKEFRPKTLLSVITAFALGILISSFFLLPALTEGKYTLRDLIGLQDSYVTRFPAFKELIFSSWRFGLGPENGVASGFSVSLGWAAWTSLFGTLILLFNRKFSKILGVTGLAGILTAIFFMTPLSGTVSQAFLWLRYFQFPWRFLSLAALSAPFMVAAVSTKLPKFAVLIGLILLVIVSSKTWNVEGYYDFPRENKDFFRPVETTGDTGEATPRWSTRFQDYWPKDVLEVVSGANISFETKIRQSELHEYVVKTTVLTQVADNTLYFPGWKAYVDNAEVPIEPYDQNWRGIITFPVPEGKHNVRVVFEETKLRKFANALSIIGIGILLALFVKKDKYGYNG
ncbi:MAG: 6-pyruvoyl-tetrahydropterin synthase-related protein [Patescibacteria group bacterium]